MPVIHPTGIWLDGAARHQVVGISARPYFRCQACQGTDSHGVRVDQPEFRGLLCWACYHSLRDNPDWFALVRLVREAVNA